MSLAYFSLLQSTVTFLAAPISASMLSYQAEKMKIVLHEVLLEEKGIFISQPKQYKCSKRVTNNNTKIFKRNLVNTRLFPISTIVQVNKH